MGMFNFPHLNSAGIFLLPHPTYMVHCTFSVISIIIINVVLNTHTWNNLQMQSPKLYWWWDGFDNKTWFLTKARNFIVCTMPRPVLGLTMTLFQWGRTSFPRGTMTGMWMWPITSILCQDLGSVQTIQLILHGHCREFKFIYPSNHLLK